MNPKKITLYLILFLTLLISNSLLSFLPFNMIGAQNVGLYTNDTGGSQEQLDGSDIGTTTIVNSDNQTQQQRMNSCLNLMNPSMITYDAYGSIIGSIKSGPDLNSSLSQIKISLSQAATIAEKGIGNNSHAIEAYLCDANGYLVYMIWVRSSNADIADTIIDPANGKILLKNSNLFTPLQQNMSTNSMTMSEMTETNR